MLDVGSCVDAKKAKGILVGDPVAVDQPFDLGGGDARKLRFVGVERAQAGRLVAARLPPEGVDQGRGLGIELLGADRRFVLAKAAGEYQPQGRMVLLATLDALFLG